MTDQEITRCITVRMHPADTESFRAAMRTHIIFNLITNHYCYLLRSGLESDHEPLRKILETITIGNVTEKARGNFLWFAKSKEELKKMTLGKYKELYMALNDKFLSGNFISSEPVKNLLDKLNEIHYSTFSSACQRISSQRSLNEIRKKEIEDKKTYISKEYEDVLNTTIWQILDKLEKELSTYYDSSYFITHGRIKGWSKVRKQWVKLLKTKASEKELLDALKEYQNKNSEKYGDHVLFELLAKPEYHELWNGNLVDDADNNGYDYVTIRAAYNRDNRYLRGHGFSWPDPFIHPVWCQFSDRKNSRTNQIILKKGIIRKSFGNQVNIQLLNDKRQFADFKFNISENDRVFFNKFILGAKTHVDFSINGVKLIFDRDTLESVFKNINKKIKNNIISPIKTEKDLQNIVNLVDEIINDIPQSNPIFSITIAFNQVKPKNEKFNKDNIYQFKEGKGKSANYIPYAIRENKITEFIGTSALSIDLGINFSASWAKLDITNKPEEKRASIDLDESYAVVKKTGHVRLLGEGKENEYLKTMNDQLSNFFSVLRLRNNLLYGMINNKPIKEQTAKHLEKFDIENKTLQGTFEFLENHLIQERKLFKNVLHTDVDKNKHKFHGGLSFERLEFLEKFIIFEKKFMNRRQIKDGKIFKAMKRGTFKHITKWQDHLNRLKEDRCKKIAAECVKLALRYDCDSIIMEDLSRYKFFEGRSRRENSQLMKWCHARIYDYLKESAEVFGIVVFRTNCAFTSRFDAITGAPGIRRPEPNVNEVLDPAAKFDGGRYLHSLNGDKVRVNDANINAAINIGVRCFTNKYNHMRATFNQKESCYVVSGPGKQHPDLEKKLINVNDNEFKINDKKKSKVKPKEYDEVIVQKNLILLHDKSKQVSENWLKSDVFWTRVADKYNKIHARRKSA